MMGSGSELLRRGHAWRVRWEHRLIRAGRGSIGSRGRFEFAERGRSLAGFNLVGSKLKVCSEELGFLSLSESETRSANVLKGKYAPEP